MRISSKAAQEYYFILKSIFPKVTVEEGRFLKEFKTSLIEFTLVHPQCTYDTLIEEFGTPQDILHEYLNIWICMMQISLHMQLKSITIKS